MSRLVLFDGNSIMNRAFYGIMGSKMLTTNDGKYTNAVYGFLAIMFKVLDDLKPDYIAVSFDLKAPTQRHKLYKEYKATRKGMPNELAEQMPMIKEILSIMNITIVEKEGYEADDILGTLSLMGEKSGVDVTIVSGDRDTFQLTTKKISVRIPHTKVGKTEVDTYDEDGIKEKYGVTPNQLIEVKGLMGDSSDNIPGVPGIGEKTALKLIAQYKSIDNIYKEIEKENKDIKGKLKENLVNNKDLAYLSKTLGTINRKVPLKTKIEDLEVKDWDTEKVFEKFKELNFNRFIERFSLQAEQKEREISDLVKIEEMTFGKVQELLNKIEETKEMVYLLNKHEINSSSRIIKKEIKGIAIYIKDENTAYYLKINENDFSNTFKKVFENNQIQKCGYDLSEDYVILKEIGIKTQNIHFDVKIAAYDLNPTNSHYTVENVANQYLGIDTSEYIGKYEPEKTKNKQLNLFNDVEENENDKYIYGFKAYLVEEISKKTLEELEKVGSLELFNNIEMPLVQILGEMQVNGMYVDKKGLIKYGDDLKAQIDVIKKEIYHLCGEEFNINSTQQLGTILFEKLKLPVYKRTKTGYSTDVDILEKLKNEHPVIEKILEYRSLVKLNSTYVEGLIPYINEKTNRIHSYFHQTITATGRISSTEPNLQNIPTRQELGKTLRKVFKPAKGYIFIDADYSQIELRVLAHISGDENMINAFMNDEDIHKQAASKVFGVPIDKVTNKQRSSAKAVNFGIVYGISDFGLAEQLDIPRKKARQYINQYLEKYSGIKEFMDNIVEEAKEKGYVETLFHRRRYIPELSSNNYTVRQFGSRAAMNTPIQGTAADIMKIAMINVYDRLESEGFDAKIVLQVHDELIIECNKDIAEKVKGILQYEMENAVTLKIPLKVDISEAKNWYEAK